MASISPGIAKFLWKPSVRNGPPPAQMGLPTNTHSLEPQALGPDLETTEH